MDILDATIVNVALPTIQRDLGLRYTSVQLVVAGYTLTFALMLITGARLVQGVAAALMVPHVLATMHVTLAPERLTGAFVRTAPSPGRPTSAGRCSVACSSRRTCSGSAGVRCSWSTCPWRSWRSSSPVGCCPSRGRRGRYGWTSSASCSPRSVCSLLLPVLQGRDLGWPAWGFGVLAAVVPLACAFVWWERRKQRKDASALVPPALVAQRPFAVGLAVLTGFLGGIRRPAPGAFPSPAAGTRFLRASRGRGDIAMAGRRVVRRRHVDQAPPQVRPLGHLGRRAADDRGALLRRAWPRSARSSSPCSATAGARPRSPRRQVPACGSRSRSSPWCSR